jgi:hypothetical protein
VKLNEGGPTVYWENGSITVIDYRITGIVSYSDACTPVEGVSVQMKSECGGQSLGLDVTDSLGTFSLWPPTCQPVCLEPWAEADDEVWHQTVTSFDATLVLRALVKTYSLSHNDSVAADVSGNGTVSGFDASVILKWVVCNYCGTDLIPSEYIGDWVFESIECGDCGTGPWGDGCVCFDEVVGNQVVCWEAVVVGDVSQNWPGPGVKVVSEGLDVEAAGRSMRVSFPVSASSVVMTVGYEGEMQVVGVECGGMVEWVAGQGQVRIAAASAGELGPVTVIFDRMVSGELQIEAEVDEAVLFGSTVKPVSLPEEYGLEQNYPNPFNPSTTIQFAVGSGQSAVYVTLKIFNVLGQEVAVLVDGIQEPGYHQVTWDGSNMASGVYFYCLKAGDFTSSRRMLLLK